MEGPSGGEERIGRPSGNSKGRPKGAKGKKPAKVRDAKYFRDLCKKRMDKMSPEEKSRYLKDKNSKKRQYRHKKRRQELNLRIKDLNRQLSTNQSPSSPEMHKFLQERAGIDPSTFPPHMKKGVLYPMFKYLFEQHRGSSRHSKTFAAAAKEFLVFLAKNSLEGSVYGDIERAQRKFYRNEVFSIRNLLLYQDRQGGQDKSVAMICDLEAEKVGSDRRSKTDRVVKSASSLSLERRKMNRGAMHATGGKYIEGEHCLMVQTDLR
jgi:hypothetical protein